MAWEVGIAKQCKSPTMSLLEGRQTDYRTRKVQACVGFRFWKSSLALKQGPPGLRAAHCCLRIAPKYCTNPVPQAAHSRPMQSKLEHSFGFVKEAGLD